MAALVGLGFGLTPLSTYATSACVGVGLHRWRGTRLVDALLILSVVAAVSTYTHVRETHVAYAPFGLEVFGPGTSALGWLCVTGPLTASMMVLAFRTAIAREGVAPSLIRTLALAVVAWGSALAASAIAVVIAVHHYGLDAGQVVAKIVELVDKAILLRGIAILLAAVIAVWIGIRVVHERQRGRDFILALVAVSIVHASFCLP